jgi:hypothetical protein
MTKGAQKELLLMLKKCVMCGIMIHVDVHLALRVNNLEFEIDMCRLHLVHFLI